MIVDLLVFGAVRANLAAAAAIALVLALRGPVRRLLGPEAAYALWGLPVCAAVASLFPSLAAVAGSAAPALSPAPSPVLAADRLLDPRGLGPPMVAAWLLGAALSAALQAGAEARFRRRVARGAAGPAVVGLFPPAVVTPADHAARFTVAERALIAAHERAHIRRGDPWANLAAAGFLAAGWFNPLVHLAARVFRLDQEAACDAAALAHRPDLRAPYARALLKAAGPASGPAPRSAAPLACGWTGGPHPVETRIRTLMRAGGAERRTSAEILLGVALLAAVTAATWAAAPTSGIASPDLWPPSHPPVTLVLLTRNAPPAPPG